MLGKVIKTGAFTIKVRPVTAGAAVKVKGPGFKATFGPYALGAPLAALLTPALYARVLKAVKAVAVR